MNNYQLVTSYTRGCVYGVDVKLILNHHMINLKCRQIPLFMIYRLSFTATQPQTRYVILSVVWISHNTFHSVIKLIKAFNKQKAQRSYSAHLITLFDPLQGHYQGPALFELRKPSIVLRVKTASEISDVVSKLHLTVNFDLKMNKFIKINPKPSGNM